MLDPFVERAIGGCVQIVRFDDQITYAKAIGTLLGCHPHHFIVIPDAGMGWTIACSEGAMDCLMEQTPVSDLLRTTTTTTTPPAPPDDLPPF